MGNEEREIYKRNAHAIERASGASRAAVKARVLWLAHEQAEGGEVTPAVICDAAAALACTVMGAGFSDRDHAARAAREIAALRIVDRQLGTVARTTPQTPERYTPPAPPPAAPAPKAAPASVMAAFAAAMRPQAPARPVRSSEDRRLEEADPTGRKRLDPEWCEAWGFSPMVAA